MATTFPQENNFDFLRLLAALMVMGAHLLAAQHSYLQESYFLHYFPAIAGMGVDIFFLISGFLITASWVHNPDATSFLRNRALRIFPALVIPVVGAAYVLGPMVTTLPAGEYFAQPLTHAYLLNLMLIAMPFLPGVFTDSLYDPHLINPPLWTLAIEFLMYVMVVSFGVVGLLRGSVALVLTAVLLGVVATQYSYPNPPPVSLFGTNTRIAFFLLGMSVYFFRGRIPWHPALALLALGGVVAGFFYPFFLLYMVTLTYLVFFCAFWKKLPFQRVAKHGDFSYGIYIYASPVQHTLVYYFPYMALPLLMVLGVTITVAFAVFSWHMVEKPALRRKRGPMHKVSA